VKYGSDAELLGKVRDGDRESFAVLWTRHALTTMTIAVSICPCDAADVVQDIWMQVWERPPTIETSFDGWLRSAIRRRAKRAADIRSRVGTMGTSLTGVTTSPTRTLARIEVLAVVEHARAAGRISASEFDAIMSTRDDLSQVSMAADNCLSPSGWRGRVSRALGKIQAMI
jgi:DNA-directed RNA polymerase specialized sigma24 family protein